MSKGSNKGLVALRNQAKERGTFREQAPVLLMVPIGAEVQLDITQAEIKNTSRNGVALFLTFVVSAGRFSGREIRSVLNIVNDSEGAESLAWGLLSDICTAIGIPFDDLENVGDLVGKTIGGVVVGHNEWKYYNQTTKKEVDMAREQLGMFFATAEEEEMHPSSGIFS